MCVENLRMVLEEIPDLKAVISSTWRHQCQQEDKDHVLKAFADHDLVLPLHEDWHTIRHWTIDKDYVKGPKPEKYTLDWRGNEISEWLSRHPEVTKWICLDDDSDFCDEHNLVLCDAWVGFTGREAELIICYFDENRQYRDRTLQEIQNNYEKHIPHKCQNNVKLLRTLLA
jgi:hypothetical protein